MKGLLKTNSSLQAQALVQDESEVIYRYLQKCVRFFHAQRPKALSAIAAQMVPITYPIGSVIYEQDEGIADTFYVIFQGTVEQKIE